MRIFLILIGFALLVSAGTASAESSWDKLIKEIDQPVMGKAPPKDHKDDRAEMLKMPEGFVSQTSEKSQEAKTDATVKFVTSYKCTNPNFPRCLMRMDRPGRVDVQNCKDITRLYIQAVASYSRCVDRRARKHVRKVVDYFNCTASGRKNCPFVYGGKD